MKPFGGVLGIVLGIVAGSGARAWGAWQLATGDSQITFALSRNQLVIDQLNTPGSTSNWLAAPCPVPLMANVWVEGREIPTSWTFTGADQNAPAGTLTFRFTNATPQLTLESIWRARPGHGPIEHWIELANRSAARVTVSHQDSLAIDQLDTGTQCRVWWVKRGGSNASTQGGTYADAVTPALNLNLVSNCDDGASPVPWLALQVGESRGLYCGWEFSGLGRIAAKAHGTDTAVDVRVGLLPEFKTDLEAGETFVVPPAFIGCYLGDIDDGSYTLHRWVIEKLRPSLPADVPDPTLAYNLYLDAGGAKAEEADVLRSAETCRDLGFETFMPDAMWFPECGDWRWDPKRFPRGIAPIEQFVHRNGMQLALWCAWSNGGISDAPGALSVRGPSGHPDWFSADFAPDWKPGPFYGGRICLGCAEAKEWAINKTTWLVGQHHLDYLKHDIGPIVTQCNKTTHRHHYGVDASYWAALGYYEVQEQLRRTFPRLILENCSGGGHIKDYGAVARTHYVVTTDTLSNLPDRQSFYDSTFAFPPLVLQAYTYEREYHVPGDEPGPFLWRSAMMGAWQIDPTNTRIWTDKERASVARSAAVYKSWIRPMLRDVKVHHVLPRPDGTNWDGLFYYSGALQRGTLFVFRPDAKAPEKTVQLKGLNSDQVYRVWGEDGAVAPAERRGADLMSGGVTVRLPERYTSELVYVQAAVSDSSRLQDKAVYLERDLLDKHWLDGLYVSIVPASPSGTQLTHTVDQPGNVIHAGVWTGRYLGGVGYQYAATLDPWAREHGGEILKALRILQEVTGKPGLLARGYVKGHGPVEEWEREGRDSPEWHQGQGRYADYRWHGDVSVDNFNAVLYGYAIYYDLAADAAQRQIIAQDVDRLMTHLLDNHCRIMDVDGEVTLWGHVGIDPDPAYDEYYQTLYAARFNQNNVESGNWQPSLRRSLMLLPDLLIAQHITGQARYLDFYRRVIARFKDNPDRRRDSGPFSLERLARVNHSSEGQAYEALYNLVRYERDPELLKIYRTWVDELWEMNWMEGNSLFTWMTRALLPIYRAPVQPGTSAALPDDIAHGSEATRLALETLRLYPVDRILHPVMNSIRSDVERNSFARREILSAHPIPIHERPLDNEYAWKGNPYQMDGWLKPSLTMLRVSCDDPSVAWFSDTSGQIFMTRDRAATWQNMTEGLRGARVQNFLTSSNRTFILFAETDQGIFITRDGGMSWRPASPAAPIKFEAPDFRQWQSYSENLSCRVSAEGALLISRDRGRTEVPSMHGWRIPRATAVFVTPWGLVASGPGGCYRSDDGENWRELKLWPESETGAGDFLHAYWMGRYYGFIPGTD